MRSFAIVCLECSLLSGCGHPSRKTEAEEKRLLDDMYARLEKRAHEIADEMGQKVEQDEDKKRQAEAERAADAKKALKQKLIQSPNLFFEVSNLTMHGAEGQGSRHVVSLSLTNKAQFSVTDVQGEVDFYGKNLEVVATVPVNLTGTIGGLSSMVFSEQLHNLSAGTAQLGTPSVETKFKVKGVKVVEAEDVGPGAHP